MRKYEFHHQLDSTVPTLVEGWWAAVVVDRTGDKVTLRWRDYPGWPKFTVRLAAVALLNPATA